MPVTAANLRASAMLPSAQPLVGASQHGLSPLRSCRSPFRAGLKLSRRWQRQIRVAAEGSGDGGSRSTQEYRVQALKAAQTRLDNLLSGVG